MPTQHTGDVVVVTSMIEPFAAVPRRTILDPRMTPKALGVLTYMIMRAGLPDWQFYVSEITKHFNCGKCGDIVRSALRELISLDYIVREQMRDDRGRIVGYRYLVSDVSPTAPGVSARPVPAAEPLALGTPAKHVPPQTAIKKLTATNDKRLQGLVSIWNATRDPHRTVEKTVLDARTKGELRALIKDYGASAEEVLRVAVLRVNALTRQQGNWWNKNRGGLGNLLPNVSKHFEAGMPGERGGALAAQSQNRYVPDDVI